MRRDHPIRLVVVRCEETSSAPITLAMIVLPVVGRELCAESRRPFNYWLRVVGAGVLTLVAALTFLPQFAPYSTRAFAGGIAADYMSQGFRVWRFGRGAPDTVFCFDPFVL